MKKIISTLLAVVILFNFIFCRESCAIEFEGTDSIVENSITGTDQEMLTNEGKVEDKTENGVLGRSWKFGVGFIRCYFWNNCWNIGCCNKFVSNVITSMYDIH